MPLPKNFQTFADFEREILKNRVGLSLEDIVEDTAFDAELDFDADDDDPFAAMRNDP